MGLVKGGFLRLFQTSLYVINFCCAGIILGIFSYFLAVLADRNLPISKRLQAIEGISGAGVVYTIFAILLTCCLAGKTFFSFLGLVLDVLFIGGMVAIAIMTRSGAHSCSGNVNTPLGSGPSNSNSDGYGANGFGFGGNENLTYAPNLGLACRLNKAAFIVAIIGAFFFLITALMQIILVRQHKKDNRFGPSPANNYTSGTAKPKFWQRKPKTTTEKDVEFGTGAGVATGTGLAASHPDVRPSHDTAYTGSTVAAPTGNFVGQKAVDKSINPNAEHGDHAPHVGWAPHNHGTDAATTDATRGDYYNAPHTAANPYGYDNNTATTGRNF